MQSGSTGREQSTNDMSIPADTGTELQPERQGGFVAQLIQQGNNYMSGKEVATVVAGCATATCLIGCCASKGVACAAGTMTAGASLLAQGATRSETMER